MTDTTIKTTVAVEKAVHNALRELAQVIFDQHGICLESVNFSWVDVSTTSEDRMLVGDVAASTLTKR